MRLLWLLIPLAFALLRLMTGKYPFSALTTLSCAVLTAALSNGSALVTLALMVSAVGDYFMAHQEKQNYLLYGIAGFAAGHILFAAHSLSAWTLRVWPIALTLILAACYALYLLRRVLPAIDRALRIPVLCYAAISLFSLCAALCRNAAGLSYWAYALGILAILFSDTMIAEGEFVGTARVRALILPTYYLCHLLITLSVITP